MIPAANLHHDVSLLLPQAYEPWYSREELIARFDWDGQIPRLIAYGRWRHSRHGAAAARYDLQPADCAQEAVKLFLDGTRMFEGGTESELFRFLCSVIDSLISHDGAKTRRRGKQLWIRWDGSDEPAADAVNESELAVTDGSFALLLLRDDLQHFLNFLEPDLAAYVRLRMKHPQLTAMERAAVLGTAVEDIWNIDRRLKRRRTQWLAR